MIKIERAGEIGVDCVHPDEQVIRMDTADDLQWYLDNLDLVVQMLDAREGESN